MGSYSKYVAFCDWLLSLGIMFSRFLHVVVCSSPPFLFIGVFHGKDMGRIIEIIKTVNPFWLIPGVICVIIFIWGESIIIHYLMHSLGIKVKKWICFLFSSVGFFFSCITPSASGGQPAQVYYMKKEDIPIPISTMVLLIITIIYKMVLVLLGVALVIFGQGFIHRYLSDAIFWFYLVMRNTTISTFLFSCK